MTYEQQAYMHESRAMSTKVPDNCLLLILLTLARAKFAWTKVVDDALCCRCWVISSKARYRAGCTGR